MNQQKDTEQNAVLNYEDLVYHIGKVEVQKLEKEKLISMHKNRLANLREKAGDMAELKKENEQLKRSNNEFLEKNKKLADLVEKLRTEKEKLEKDRPARGDDGKYTKRN